MAHFYATVGGSRDTQVTKCGTKKTGINAHVRGWNIGARTKIEHFKDGQDVVTIFATKGSHGQEEKEIGYIQDGVFTPKIGTKNPLGKKIKLT